MLARLDDTEARRSSRSRGPSSPPRARSSPRSRRQLDQAERDYARQQELYDRQLVAPQALDAARAQRDMLRARLGQHRGAGQGGAGVAVAWPRCSSTTP